MLQNKVFTDIIGNSVVFQYRVCSLLSDKEKVISKDLNIETIPWK